MSYVRFNIATEVKKFLANKPTKVSAETLLHIIGRDYLKRTPKR